MKIAFIASECTPFAKTGGLADVAGTLPHWIKSLGNDIRVFIPKYRQVVPEKFNVRKISSLINISVRHKVTHASAWEGSLFHDVPIYFIEYDKYFDRDYLYGTPEGDYPDNDKRFIFFTRAVFQLMQQIGFKPDIIHCNDWQTGLFPVYLKTTLLRDPFYKHVKSVFTIHNIAYQGIFNKRTMNKAELDWRLFNMEGVEYYDHICFLKAGIVFADRVTTVSPTYAYEIRSSGEFGFGMEGILKMRSKDLSGIINGIDYKEWNPHRDAFLKAPYSSASPGGKKKCKKEIQQIFNLKVSDTIPCIGIVSRLAAQKGFDLLAGILKKIMHENVQLVILGTGDKAYHTLLEKAAKKFSKNLGISLKFDNSLAHKIYAGCDFFLMPSHYEPCGLGQMIAMCYGTIPIVMKTGGLADTVIDFEEDNTAGNGIVFASYTELALMDTIKRALRCWKDKKKRTQLIKNLFATDFRWKTSAEKYCDMYRRVLYK